MIRKKHWVVIAFSSLIVALALISTLIGYFVYVNLTSSRYSWRHSRVLARTYAKIYSKHVEIPSIKLIKLKSGRKPKLVGRIINAGNKPVASIVLQVRFLDEGGKTLYTVMFQPLKASSSKSRREYILPAGSLDFSYGLLKCPAEIRNSLKDGENWSDRMAVDIVAIEFL